MLGEIVRQQIADLAVVVDDQDVRGRFHRAFDRCLPLRTDREYAAASAAARGENCIETVSKPAFVTLADTLALALTNFCDVYSL